MTYSLPTTSVESFLSELNKIRRGIHKNFKGDSIANGEGVLDRFCKNNPEIAIDFACDMKFGVVSDFHPDRVKAFANRMIIVSSSVL